MALDDLLIRLRSESATPATPCVSRGVAPKPPQLLAATHATSATPENIKTEYVSRWPAVWHIRVGGKPITMVDFDHEPPAEIERQLRARFGCRLEHFELKGGKSCRRE